jgi:flagellar hook-length control protein FliK
MQNLTLQVAQVLKGATDKGNSMSDKSAAEEPNLSFQMLLNQQVKTHQSKAQKGTAQQKLAPEPQDTKAKDIKAEDVQADWVASERKNEDLIGSSSNILIDQIAGIAKQLPDAEDNVDMLAEEVANKGQDTNTLSLNIPISAPVLWASVAFASELKNTKENQLVKVDEQIDPATEAELKKQGSLNVMQSNKTAISQQDDFQTIQPIADTKLATEQTRWLEAMQGVSARQIVEAEPAMPNIAKESNGKMIETKVVDIKNMELPISLPSQQSQAAQNMAPVVIQQIGSSNSIQVYPGKTGWDQAISQKVLWMVGAGEQSATLTLNPPDLGPLQVVISVHNDKADTTFISNNAEVRQALQDGMSNLREKMSESGLQLGQANVSSGERSQREFQPTTQNQRASQRGDSAPVLSEEKASRISVRTLNGLVDTFV